MPSNSKKRRSARRQIVFLCVAAMLLGVGYYFLAGKIAARGTVGAFFETKNGQTPEIRLEVAKTTAERARGLMFRKPGEMAEDEGMIFVFPQEDIQSFWMKNTYISLDMIFIDRELNVVGVLHEVPILNEKPRRVTEPSMYVVELIAGVARKLHIEKGSRIVLRGEL